MPNDVTQAVDILVFKRTGVIDHDHETGKVRGLLCHECNTALGKFGDDPAILLRAVDYLG